MDEPPDVDFARIASEVGLNTEQVTNVAKLLDGGNTVPFITRYRKEQTGNLDEEQIRQIQRRVSARRQLSERADTIRRLVDAQGKLTPELSRAIARADTLKRLDDLYLPFRPKRRSRAMQARERGLEPLSECVWAQDAAIGDLDQAAAGFIDAGAELPGVAEVLQGASDILAERISEDAEVRRLSRKTASQTGRLVVSATKAAQESGQEYRDYFDYSESISRIPPHRVLALNRGEKAGALRVKFQWDIAAATQATARQLQLSEHRFCDFLQRAAEDALSRLVEPSLERELRREITEYAESHAVTVFARNLKNLLLRPPLKGQRVVAVDPGFRTGSKLAALDEFGNCLATDVVYVTGGAEKRAAARGKLSEFLKQHECRLLAVGNGTACRESEELIAEMIAEELPGAQYTIVNEAGASIYSTGNVAREEFPHLDATARGTISIGRRLQDPLSELVKIDPQHIGVGMYQHDVSSRRLKDSLEEVIESCVNFVGVDLNTASASLLRHVSGLNQLMARRVVAWREEHGRFATRRQLLDVAGIGEATFTQAAGFLKISGGDAPLDNTWIHPESYDAAQKVLDRLSLSPQDLVSPESGPSPGRDQLSQLDPQALSQEIGVGLPTCRDILEALARPGRDPRTDWSGPTFKQGVLKLEDLDEGMELTGTVLNVVDFGVFVDVGLKDSGLVHVSQMSPRYVKSPHELAAVGDAVTVWVLAVDRERRRVSLTMIKPGTPRETPAPKRKRRDNESAQTGEQPSTGSSAGAAKKTKSRPPKTERTKRPSSHQTIQPPNLTNEMISGRQPLTGFDELKELWKNRDRGDAGDAAS